MDCLRARARRCAHATSRFQSAAHIAQACHRIGKKHRAKARKHKVELVCWQSYLGVSPSERDIVQVACANCGPGKIEEGIAAINTEDGPGRADTSCELQRGIAKAAPYIDAVLVSTIAPLSYCVRASLSIDLEPDGGGGGGISCRFRFSTRQLLR